jgi:predicted nucleotidyltransferase
MTCGLQVESVRSLLAELLEQSRAVEAAVLYGSAARGDMEVHSDIVLPDIRGRFSILFIPGCRNNL